MGVPAYYLVVLDANGNPVFDAGGLPIANGGRVDFPIPARWDPYSENITRTDFLMETELGLRWVYKQFDRRVWNLTFRCNPTNRAFFEDLDDAVGGERDPFAFVFDIDDVPEVAVFVRKGKDFLREKPIAVDAGGAIERWFDITLELSEEPIGLSVAF